MAEQIILKNKYLKVVISALGAEMQSIKNNKNTEFLWYGDQNIWAGHAPILFPICGGLKDDKFIYQNKEYILNKHGFGKFSEFDVESISDNQVVFLLQSNKKTVEVYPFDFQLRVIYTLIENSIEVKYTVKNLGNEIMYFSIGAHEAYLCADGIENYSVLFDKNENLDAYVLDGNLLENNTVKILEDSNMLPLKYEYFAVDALVFKHINSKSVTLKHKTSNKKIKVDFDGFNYFLLWTKPNAPYICIEPWCGIQDNVQSNYDLTQKEGIETIVTGGLFEKSHKITFEE